VLRCLPVSSFTDTMQVLVTHSSANVEAVTIDILVDWRETQEITVTFVVDGQSLRGPVSCPSLATSSRIGFGTSVPHTAPAVAVTNLTVTSYNTVAPTPAKPPPAPLTEPRVFDGPINYPEAPEHMVWDGLLPLHPIQPPVFRNEMSCDCPRTKARFSRTGFGSVLFWG